MKKHLIINADDLGFTLGINVAIKRAHLEGYLTHSSLMANMPYFEDAVDNVVRVCPNLKVGVHINLTCGKSLLDTNLLSKNGEFRNSFMNILLLRKSSVILEHIEKEIELQILKIKDQGIAISHLDGHEHIHVIPSINKIVKKLALKYNIPRVREINENIFESVKFNHRTASKVNYIKLLLLKFLSCFNHNEKKVNFYSILNTCEITDNNLFAFLESTSHQTIEIMLHPGVNEENSSVEQLDERFRSFLTSKHREKEYQLCFNKKFENYG